MVAVASRQFGPQRLQQAVGQSRRVENRAQQQQTCGACLFRGGLDQHIADFRVVRELLRALQQPDVELAFGRAQVGGQFGVVALRIIHQKAGMHLEELRQQRARGLRHVRARSVFDLREIGLADGLALAQLLADGAHQLELRHGTAQTAQRAFHFAQVPDFLAQLHRPRPECYISNRDNYIAICDVCQERIGRVFRGLRERFRTGSSRRSKTPPVGPGASATFLFFPTWWKLAYCLRPLCLSR